MKPQLPHWAIALLLAAGLHVGLAVAWVGLQKAPAPLPVDAGGLDVVVAIAPASSPAAAVEQPAAELVPVETVLAAVEPVIEVPTEPEVETVIEPTVEPVIESVVEPMAKPIATAEPKIDLVEALPEVMPGESPDELPVEQPPIAVAEPIPEMPLLVAAPPVEPKPTAVVKARPATKPKTPAKPQPKPKPLTPIKPVVQAVSRVRKVVSEAVKQPPHNQSAQVQQKFSAQFALAGAAVDSNQAVATVSAAQPSQSAEQRAAEQGYYGRLARRIAKHKRYPRAAKRERSTGTVVVTFTVAVDGRLQQSRVTKSSGDPRLDEAALKMLKRASPFPPLPVAMGRRSQTITLPVEFALRR